MKCTIELTDDNRVLFSQDQAAPFTQISLMLYSVMLNYANSVIDIVPEAAKAAVKAEIYDIINIGASNVLGKFAPEIEVRPNLTTEAILKAENEIIKSKTAEQLHKEYNGPAEKETATDTTSEGAAENELVDLPVTDGFESDTVCEDNEDNAEDKDNADEDDEYDATQELISGSNSAEAVQPSADVQEPTGDATGGKAEPHGDAVVRELPKMPRQIKVG